MTMSGDADTGPVPRLDLPAWSGESPDGQGGPDQQPAPAPEAETFTISRRGYDRREVDARMGVLRGELVSAAAAWRRESQRATWAEHELRAATARLSESPNTPEGFGHRVQKLLAMAEEEAAGIRSAATADAGAILEQARADAEAHRVASEQVQLAREEALAREAEQHQAQLADWQRQVTEQLESVREQAAQIRAAAEHEAEEIRLDAQANAEELRNLSARVIHQLHEMAEEELRRVCSPYEAIRNELSLLRGLLGGGLVAARHQADPPDPYPPQELDPYAETADALLADADNGGADDGPDFRRLASAG